MALEKVSDFKEFFERLIISKRTREIVMESLRKEEQMKGSSKKEPEHFTQIPKDKFH